MDLLLILVPTFIVALVSKAEIDRTARESYQRGLKEGREEVIQFK